MEIEERRQLARETYFDNGGAPDARGDYAPIEMAIETATRVQITMDAVLEMESGETSTHGLTRALRALGFEVIE